MMVVAVVGFVPCEDKHRGKAARWQRCLPSMTPIREVCSEGSVLPKKSRARPPRGLATRISNLQCSSGLIEFPQKVVVERETPSRVGCDHSLHNARGRRRYISRDNPQIRRMLLQFAQFRSGIRAAIDGRFSGDGMKQRRSQAVNVTANILGLVIQSFR